jgi:two-component system, cell cycle response regulator DivK
MATQPRPLVLVIDDNEDNRELHALLLANYGFDVVQAGDGVAALALTADRLPAVAVTDLRMPGDVSAADLCRHFNELNVPVIALTGVGPGDEHEAMRRAGCAAVMMKPLAPDRLLSEINRVLTSDVPRNA